MLFAGDLNAQYNESNCQFIIDIFLEYEKKYYDKVTPYNRRTIASVIATEAEMMGNNELAEEYRKKADEIYEEMLNNN